MRLNLKAFQSERLWLWLGVALGVGCFQKFGADYFYYLNLSTYFCFSWDYVWSLEGLGIGGRWLSALVLAWFGVPWVGAVTTTLICVLGYVLCRKTLFELRIKNYELRIKNCQLSIVNCQLSIAFALFLAWLLVRPVNYFDVAISVLAMMGLFLAWGAVMRSLWRLVLGIVVLVVGYLGFGGYVYGLCIIMIFFEWRRARRASPLQVPFTFHFLLFTFILVTAITPYIAHKYVYTRPLKDTYLSGLKRDAIFAKPGFKAWVWAKEERLFYRTHVLAWKADWTTIREETGRYWDGFDFESGRFTDMDQDLLNYYKLSVVLTQSLGEAEYTKRLVNPYFAVMFPGMFPGGDGTHSFFWSDFFYHLGAVADARFETQISMVCHGLTRRNVERMFVCNAVLDDTAFAEKYDAWALRYPIAPFPERGLSNAKILFQKTLLPREEYLNQAFPDARIIALQATNPDNAFAFEYVVFCALQYYRQHAFVLEQLENFRRLGYAELPVYFEQALLAARFGDLGRHWELYPLREAVLLRYEHYQADRDKFLQGLMSATSFENKYRDAYWFQFDYVGVPDV